MLAHDFPLLGVFWSIFVILVPFLGVVIYVIANGDGMRNRDIAASGVLTDAEFEAQKAKLLAN